MNLILFDNDCRQHLLPLTFTRPAADMRCGILTIREKWEKYLHLNSSSLTENYLQTKFPYQTDTDNLFVLGSLLPNRELVNSIQNLQSGEALFGNDTLLALRCNDEIAKKLIFTDFTSKNAKIASFSSIFFSKPHTIIRHTFQIFQYNEQEIALDFELLTQNRPSAPLAAGNVLIGDAAKLFIEPGAQIFNATLNTISGYIYIGKDAEVMEGSMIRGPFALCEHSTTKMGAKIYGATTIGPHCKVGGELSNVVIFGYTNKAHDGFLGNSVLGEWCNIGADTNASNLKNDYANVKIWDYCDQKFMDTQLQFCGLIMGDHSKCGINSMFNTGTVVGVYAALFGGDYHRNFVPSFSFGNPHIGYSPYNFERAIATAERVFHRRNKILDQTEQNILRKVYDMTFNNENNGQ